eukprot:5326255-Prymnesium_polylepis.2
MIDTWRAGRQHLRESAQMNDGTFLRRAPRRAVETTGNEMLPECCSSACLSHAIICGCPV